MAAGKKLNAQQIAYIRELYEQGYSNNDVARIANVGVTTAVTYKPEEMKNPYHHITTGDISTIIDMWLDGCRPSQIAPFIGCSGDCVRRIIRREQANG